MPRPARRFDHVFASILLLAGCATTVPAEPAGEPAKSPTYHIYAGNIHAHTSFTWSHGDQWQKPKPAAPDEKKEPGIYVDESGAQHPAKTQVAKPDWQKFQGPPA